MRTCKHFSINILYHVHLEMVDVLNGMIMKSESSLLNNNVRLSLVPLATCLVVPRSRVCGFSVFSVAHNVCLHLI
jgi:hypothetical protein